MIIELFVRHILSVLKYLYKFQYFSMIAVYRNRIIKRINKYVLNIQMKYIMENNKKVVM